MEKPMNYVLLLPLEKLAICKVVVTLWNQAEVLAQFEVGDSHTFSYQASLTSLHDGTQLVRKLLSKLMLPDSLLKRFLPLIKSIGSEVLEWKTFHAQFLRHSHGNFEVQNSCYSSSIFDKRVLKRLSWTSVGTVNYRKTAEQLVRLEMLDLLSLYKLACLYCLEDYAPVLWKKLPRKTEKIFWDGLDIYIPEQPHLDAFWFKMLYDEESYLFYSPESFKFVQNAFQKSAYTANKAAVEYFFQRVTHEERENLLWRTAEGVASKQYPFLKNGSNELPEKKFADVLSYLMSQMSTEQNMELLRTHPLGILVIFAEWPWEKLFLDVAELTWDFLSVDDYYNILQFIDDALFRDFFLRSPSNFKNYFVDQECLSGTVLTQLFHDGHSENITFIFRNIDAAAKVRLVFSKQGFQIFCNLIEEGHWHLLKLFIREAMLSKEDGERLKETLKQHFYKIYEGEEYKCKFLEWEQFFQFDESDLYAPRKKM